MKMEKEGAAKHKVPCVQFMSIENNNKKGKKLES